jgi:hypothetical protein
MKRSLLVGVLLSLVALAAQAQSNAAPSLHVALNPCQVFSGSLAANTAYGITVRGACNIPAEATAVEVAVIVSATDAGSLKAWEYDGLEPSAAVMTYAAAGASSLAVPRLCEPAGECFHDVSLKSSTATTITLTAVGYFQPPE